jgi:hypothetical protein
MPRGTDDFAGYVEEQTRWLPEADSDDARRRWASLALRRPAGSRRSGSRGSVPTTVAARRTSCHVQARSSVLR